MHDPLDLVKVSKMINLVKQFAKCESGATAIEYALMAGIIGVGVVTAAQTLTGKISSSFGVIGDALTTNVTAGGGSGG